MNERPEGERLVSFEIQRQPNDETCGATCLSAIYRYFEAEVPVETLIEQIPTLEDGGTLGVLLATDALKRGYDATLLTWNLRLFDPTWFGLPAGDLQDKLRARAAAKQNAKLGFAAQAYIDFLDQGGKIEMRDLTPGLLLGFLRRRLPILTGLSATFLYRDPRERPADDTPDDIAGDPVGHFTVLTGYTPSSRELLVSDPLHPNPLSVKHTYPVDIDRLVGAIYLGVLTYDANLVVIEPRG
ncbi:cysteine peptidase family C39 domain-containing protein [Engelhardtia mirabilis]|uniref:Peptidase C39 domain-containing protein n=1 Tax=Engelhardtia mirabilis TaxID=2528011 RepID=A0A518BMH5_9BACT|nr:hypothetical protein Pla133_32470 [Planctomycetes bacterium Pla133]QDV02479.1 hypothetical protein Pla86_32460 [Planctomycetes bacterium Pla86]